jgi:hypothetical protein
MSGAPERRPHFFFLITHHGRSLIDRIRSTKVYKYSRDIVSPRSVGREGSRVLYGSLMTLFDTFDMYRGDGLVDAGLFHVFKDSND